MASEDKIDSIIDRQAFADDLNFAVKTCENIVNLVKQTKASIVAISSASNASEFNSAMQKAEALTTSAALAHKELTDNIKEEKQAMADAVTTLKSVTGSLEANIKAQLQYKAELKAVQTELKAAQKAAAANNTTIDDSSQKLIELAKREIELKQAISESNAVIKNQAKENALAQGSYDEMDLTLKQLRATYNSLNEAERNGDVGQSLAAGINELDQKLKTIDASTGKFNRNVGNYAGSLNGAFESIKSKLNELRASLDKTNESGAKLFIEDEVAYKKAYDEMVLLEGVVSSLDKPFASSKAEMRAFTEAAKQLGQEFGTADELFQNFVQKVGEQKDTLDDIQNTINFNASDTKYLDGIVAGVNGIVGAYGAWQAATVLVGDDNEALQKSMAKLQAILTLVQSLQAVLNAVQTESGAIQTALAAKTALVTAAKRVEALVFGSATVALEANTVATETAATAQVALAGGEAAATAGAIGLRTAIISTGIGALVIGLVYGITKLVGIISDWVGADERAIEIQKSLTEALNAVAQAQIDLTEETRKAALERVEAYQREIDILEARGVSSAKQLALEAGVAKEKQKILTEELISMGVTEASRADYHERYMVAKAEEAKILQEIANINQQAQAKNQKVDEDALKNLQNKLDAAGAYTNGIKQQYDYQTELLKNQTDNEQALALNKAKADKLAADEARKLIFETAKIESDLVQTKNNTILSSDKSTYNQKLEALKSNLKEQKKLASAEKENTISDPTISGADRTIAIKKYNASIKKLDEINKEAILKLTEDYNKKLQEANQNLAKLNIEASIKASETILDNEGYTFDQRFKALESYTAQKQNLLQSDYENQKALLIKTIPDNEIRLKQIAILDAQYKAQDLDLTANVLAKKASLTKEYYDKIAQEEADWQAKALARLDENAAQQQATQSFIYAQEYKALSDKFVKSQISAKDFDKQAETIGKANAKKLLDIEIEKANETLKILKETNSARIKEYDAIENDIFNLENEYLKASTEAQKAEIQKQIDAKKEAAEKFKNVNKDIADAEINLNNLIAQASQKNTEDKKKKLEDFKAIVDQVSSYILQASSLIQSILDAKFETQKQQTQEQIDDIDRQKEKDIEAANSQALTAAEKADKIATINAIAQAKKEALERKQREIDNQKAKQDRIFALFNIAANTATAVIKAVAESPLTGGLPFSAIAIAIGAVQAAAILAAPLPKYKDGTSDHIGGPAIVGDGLKHEYAVTPSGEVFKTPAKPTLINLPKHSKVFKDEKAFMDSLNLASMQLTLQAGGQSISQKDFEVQLLENKISETNALLDKLTAKIENLPIQQLHITEDGLTHVTAKGNKRLVHVQNYFKS